MLHATWALNRLLGWCGAWCLNETTMKPPTCSGLQGTSQIKASFASLSLSLSLTHTHIGSQKVFYNGTPNIPVRRVLRKRLHFEAYKLSIVLHAKRFRNARNTIGKPVCLCVPPNKQISVWSRYMSQPFRTTTEECDIRHSDVSLLSIHIAPRLRYRTISRIKAATAHYYFKLTISN
jgi:hypothetical protein